MKFKNMFFAALSSGAVLAPIGAFAQTVPDTPLTTLASGVSFADEISGLSTIGTAVILVVVVLAGISAFIHLTRKAG